MLHQPSSVHTQRSSRPQRALTAAVLAARRRCPPASRAVLCVTARMSLPWSRKVAQLQQNFNSAGISLFLQILGSNQSLALPHISVSDIRHVDWDALAAAGYRACIFDKDNTICRPFALEVDPLLRESMTRCQSVFAGRVVLFSNSAGLEQYDPEGKEAEALERQFGLHVLRHKEKKPAGSCAEAEQHFGCSASEMVMVGDRYLTDVVFGNRHGMLTVRVAPLTTEGEPPGVKAARVVEEYCVSRWSAAGERAPALGLLGGKSDASRFVTIPRGLSGVDGKISSEVATGDSSK